MAESSACTGWQAHALLSPKHSIRLGCSNAHSLCNPTHQNSRLRSVISTMIEKEVQLLALSDIRWPGHGD